MLTCNFFAHKIDILNLLQSEPIQLGPASFLCPFCSKIMKAKRDMHRHIRTHTGEKPIVCNYCYSYSTNRKDSLASHIRIKHPETFECL